ncbi:MAG TPA: phosphotransferase, partial [Polyangiaceae bacterium]
MPRHKPSGPDRAELERLISRKTGVPQVVLGERVQELWSGYGEIRRATLSDASSTPVIVKHVVPPGRLEANAAEARSHRRKLRSYEVECAFYRTYARQCGEAARVPAAIHAGVDGDRMLLVLEDLDASGFALRRRRVSASELAACLRWLAHFHAQFLGARPESLWKVGTYWHLATRPDELRALGDSALEHAAPLLDERLNRARHRTLVHGDAKLQNFCFAPTGARVAAVDFQYVGGGVGVKDVAYFLTSCLTPRELERDAETHLDDYFRALRAALEVRAAPHADPLDGDAPDASALEAEWRELYPVACAD